MATVSDLPSERFPLAGLRILVTRQETSGSSLSEILKIHGASVIKAPMNMITPPTSWELFDKTVKQAAKFEWAIFTSSNGVRHCFSRLKELELSPKYIFSNLKIATTSFLYQLFHSARKSNHDMRSENLTQYCACGVSI